MNMVLQSELKILDFPKPEVHTAIRESCHGGSCLTWSRSDVDPLWTAVARL